MPQTLAIIIQAGKAALLELHKRNEEESEDDTWYIPTLKTVIRGIASSAPDPVGRHQVRQALINYARELYLSFWLESEGTDITDNQACEEGLYWFDYIYAQEAYPE